MKSKILLSAAIAIASLSASAQSPLILRSRVQYQYLNTGPVLYDSLVYHHSNNRNSAVTPSVYDKLYPVYSSYAYDSATVYRISGGGTSVIQTHSSIFNSAGLPVVAVQHIPANGTATASTYTTLYTYNSSMLPDSITTSIVNNGALSVANRTTYVYNSGKLAATRNDAWNVSTGWTHQAVDSFFTTGGAGSDSFHVYLYWNGTNAYNEQSRNKYTRDAGNRILRDSFFSAGAFDDVTIYEYDAQGRVIKDSVWSWIAGQSMAQMTDKHYYNYDGQSRLTGIKRNMHHFIFNTWNDITLDSFTYNNTHQLTSYIRYDLTASTLQPWETSFVNRYYYGFPVSVTGVKEAGSLQLYPVPATSFINLSMSFSKPQSFSVRIFDVQGRLVCQWQEDAQQTYSKQIPVTNMAPGQYTLHLWAGDESCSRQFTIMR